MLARTEVRSKDDLQRRSRAGLFAPGDHEQGTIPLFVPILFKERKSTARWRTGRSTCVSVKRLHFCSDQKTNLKTGERLLIRLNLPGIDVPLELGAAINRRGHATNEITASFQESSKRDVNSDFRRLVQFLAERTWSSVARLQEELDDTSTHIAVSPDDYMLAADLLYREYQPRGYCRKNDSRVHFSYFAALPDSRTFLISRNTELLGTFSLIPDGVFGLPAESIYPEVIAELRERRQRLAELSLLSLDGDSCGGRRFYLLTNPLKLFTFVELLKAMVDYACARGITDLLVATHPKHRFTYEFLLFESVGEVREYESVGGNPAILLHADISNIRRLYKLSRHVRDPDMTLGVAAYLYHFRSAPVVGLNRRIVSKLLDRHRSHLPVKVTEYLEYCYPGF